MATQQYTPQYQDSNYLGKLANNIYNSTQGSRNQLYANANQAYNNSGRNMAEALGAKGLLHSGTYANELTGNEQNRNTALAGVDTAAYNSALSQAVNAGQLGLSEQGQLANQNIAQQGVTNQNTQYNQGQAQQASQFGVTSGQTGQQIANQASQYNQGQTQQASQFGQNLGLSQQQLAAQQSQFGQNFGLQQQQTANQASQYGQGLAEQTAARLGSQGLTQQQITNQASQYNQGQAQQASQYTQGQAQQASQFGQSLGLQQGALTGQYQGAPTAATADQSYSQQLALLQALQNYNLGVGQVTDTLPQFAGYNYGDTLKQLLARLGSGGQSPSATAPAATTVGDLTTGSWGFNYDTGEMNRWIPA